MSLLLVPTLGPFHILHPRYNAVSVLELVRQHRPVRLLLASRGPQDLETGVWRDENDLPLFHLLPWAVKVGIPVEALDSSAGLKAEADRFVEALAQFPKGQKVLAELGSLEQALQTFLTTPKTPEDIYCAETLSALKGYLEGYTGRFGEGPATGFRQERMEKVASNVKRQTSNAENLAVLVDLLDYPVLRELLPEALNPQPSTPTEAERQRSVLDRAWRLEQSDDWGALLTQLQGVEGPEAQYCAAQVYLAAGQPGDALGLLEGLVHSDFSFPEYLPGYTLARYGQLADLAGEREKALRAYQAVLALSWAPQEAREIAVAGGRNPFKPG